MSLEPEDESPEAEAESDLSEIEAALGSLSPARGRFDRDLVMYRAGQVSSRSSRPGPRGWMAVAASFALLALGEAALLARRPAERIVERVVVVRDSAASPIPLLEVVVAPPSSAAKVLASDPGPGGHDRLAWQVIRYGLDALPAPSPSAGGDRPFSRRALREELGKILDLGDPS